MTINLGKQTTAVDWLRLVFPYNFDVSPIHTFKSKSNNTIQGVQPLVETALNDVNDILSVMGLPQVKERMEDVYIENEWSKTTPLWGYDNAIALGNIKVMYNNARIDTVMPKSRADMGVAFEISGKGCRELEWYLQKNGADIYDFFKRLYRYRPDMRVTRLDIAHDIINGSPKLKPRSMRTCATKRKISTRLKSFTFIESGSLDSGKILGDTFSLGNSSVRLVVYDKLGERVHSHGDSVAKSIKRWTRWEMRFMYEYADAFIDEMRKDEPMPSIYFRMLRQTMKVVVDSRGHSKNRYRLPEESWWRDFTIQSEKDLKSIPVSHPEKNSRLIRKHSYIDKQVSKTLATTLLAHQEAGGNPAVLLSHWIRQGMNKLTYDDVVQAKGLIQQAIDLEETKAVHEFVPEQLRLDLTDDDYKDLNKKLIRLETYFDSQF